MKYKLIINIHIYTTKGTTTKKVYKQLKLTCLLI